MPDLSFSESDYQGLPQELQGKSPKEIAEYYSARERDAQGQLEVERAKGKGTPSTPAAPSSADFWKDPVKATQQVAAAEFDKLSQMAQESLIGSTKMVVKANHSDWTKFEKDIETIMNSVPPASRIDPKMWETAYYQVKGLKADELVAQARSGQGSEVPTGANTPTAPVVKPTVPTEASRVTRGFGLTDEQYLKAQERIETNTWPLTMSNTRRG